MSRYLDESSSYFYTHRSLWTFCSEFFLHCFLLEERHSWVTWGCWISTLEASSASLSLPELASRKAKKKAKKEKKWLDISHGSSESLFGWNQDESSVRSTVTFFCRKLKKEKKKLKKSEPPGCSENKGSRLDECLFLFNEVLIHLIHEVQKGWKS